MLGIAVCSGGVVEERIMHAGAEFRVVRIDPEKVKLVWRGGDGKPYATFDVIQKSLSKDGRKAVFMMNAGIFEPGLVPSGLHVEDGKELRALNPRDGEGNFFLKPNGVFAITSDARASVLDSTMFRSVSEPWRLAVQSGPILLKNGHRHHRFVNGSPNLKHRNGVGVDEKGRVVFAMTDKRQEVNFWDFAGLFIELGCRNALFLDGDISQMAVNPEGEVKSNRFAAVFVVVE